MGGKTVSNDKEKADIFAKMLSETFSGKTYENDFDNNFKKEIEDYVNSLNMDEVDYEEISMNELKFAIKTLRFQAAPGIDNVNNILLKGLSENFLEVVRKLFNKCLSTGEWPKNWKHSKITMIPKKSDNKQDPTNYRPISLTSCIGKLLEKIIKRRLSDFLEENNLIASCQSGFRAHRRTTDNLFFLTQKIKESFNKGKRVCGLFFDIAKAFDRVWHKGLIYKMSKMGIPMYIIRLVYSFLGNRTFVVDIDGEISEMYRIETGVPQGAVLSPLLFSIFINDIPMNSNRNQSESMLFADDLATLIFFKGSKEAKRIAQNYLNKLEEWLFKWRMKMAVNKCNYIIFCKKDKKEEFNLVMNGQNIPQTKEILFLGVLLDHKLNFKCQVSRMRAKCAQRLNIIKILSHKWWKIAKKTLINIYRALIGSIIEYSFFIVSCISLDLIYKLQANQNRAMRSVFGLKFDPVAKKMPSSELVREKSGLQGVYLRLHELNIRFLSKAIIYNPFIIKLCTEYKEGISSIRRSGSEKTPLCVLEPVVLILLKAHNEYLSYIYFM